MSLSITPQHHGLGWVPDLPDQRDKIYEPLKKLGLAPLPEHVDLRTECPAVYDQGQLGSCTANALAAAFDFDRHKQGKPFMTPSRLFIYWNERSLEGTTNSDAGANIRDGVKVLRKIGTPPETDWPYVISTFTEKPSAKSFTDASANQALTYQRIQRPTGDATRDMQTCLAEGYPFVSGISVYQSFESPTTNKTGIIPMPGKGETLLGGHAILVIGYDSTKQWFVCRNSWGTVWGDKGYFYLPFAYLSSRNLSSDMWVIKTVEI
ncbi:MAG: C1 family peptidase [Candidatus Saccharibacteria bacterium]